MQGRRVIVWCYEDTPLIWPEAVRRIATMPTDVRDVMVGGDWLMRDREVLSLERKKVLRDALQVAQSFKAEMARIDAAG